MYGPKPNHHEHNVRTEGRYTNVPGTTQDLIMDTWLTVVTWETNKSEVSACRVKRGAHCWTNHHHVWFRIRVKLDTIRERSSTKSKHNLNVAYLYPKNLEWAPDSFNRQPSRDESLDEHWWSFGSNVHSVCKAHLTIPAKKALDWFTDNDSVPLYSCLRLKASCTQECWMNAPREQQ